MTKRHFTIFAEVCRQMSFSKAAEALNTTQPTVSLAIKELEEHYGVRLFERMNRRIYMTEAGRALLSTAQEVLRGFQQAEDQLRKAPYRLRVGANVTFGATRLPRVLAQFRRKCPQVELSALVGNSDGIERLLLENRLDVGLVDNVTFSQHLRVQPCSRRTWPCSALLPSPAAPSPWRSWRPSPSCCGSGAAAPGARWTGYSRNTASHPSPFWKASAPPP